MSMQTVPHINFNGEARAALDFYRAVFGGEVTAATYRDAGHAADGPDAERIVWGQVRADNGLHVMAHDVPAGTAWERGVKSFFVSLRGDSQAEIEVLWHRLADGAQVLHGLAPAPWTPLYGMLEDRFGVTWVMDVAHAA